MPAPPSILGKTKDPSQVGLRRHKRQWNASYKDISQKLKAFKNALNGKGDVKFNLPPSDIKFPLPNEVGSFLDGIASEFQSLLTDAHAILQEQEHYSRVRRKKKPKSPVSPETVKPTETGPAPVSAPEAEIVNTLSRLGSEHERMLEAYASNKITRFWQYLKSPFSNQPMNKQRISLLSLSADLFYNLKDFENEILSLKANSIPKSMAKYQSARYTFEAIKSKIERLGKILENKETTKSQKPTAPTAVPTSEPVTAPKPSAPVSKQSKIKDIENNIHIIYDIGLSNKEVMHINGLIQNYHKEADENTKSMFFDRIIESYNNLMKSVANEVQKKYGPVVINSPQDIINLIEKNRPKTAFNDILLVKESHNALSRFLKKQLIKARSYDRTAGDRLEIVDSIHETNKIIKKMMDSLEGGLDIELLTSFLEVLEENMKSINQTLSILITLYEKDFYKRERYKKDKEHYNPQDKELDEFTDYLMRKKVRRDISKGLF